MAFETSIFQHLNPDLAEQGQGDFATMWRQLKDIQREKQQGVPSLVRDTKLNTLAVSVQSSPSNLLSSFQRERFYPQSSLPVTRAGLSALLADLENDLALHELTLMNDSAKQRCIQTLPGVLPDLAFNSPPVAHISGNRWMTNLISVSGGGMDSNAVTVKGGILRQDRGFIGLWVSLTPLPADGSTPYRIEIEGWDTPTNYQNTPPERTLKEDEAVQWTSGRMFVPLAFVVAPAGDRAAVLVTFGQRLLFPENYSLGLPNPLIALDMEVPR